MPSSRLLSRPLLPLWLLLAISAASDLYAEPTTRSTAIAQQLQNNQHRYEIAGQAVLIAKNGEVIYRGSQGFADLATKSEVKADHVFPVYSVSKLLATVLVMQLIENGRLELDKPIATYLSSAPKAWQKISVGHVLNHMSGLPEYYDSNNLPMSFPATKQAVFNALADTPLLFPAGTNTRYTGTNFLVLAAILEAQYGAPYNDIVTERILKKLKLSSTYLGRANAPRQQMVNSYIGKAGQLQKDELINWPDYSTAHGELYATADDLAIFLHALSRGELLKKQTLQMLWQPQAYTNGKPGWFASGWEYGTSGKYQHVGHDGGAKVRLRLLYKDGLDGDVYTIIYLTNGSARNVWSRTLVESAMAAALPEQFPAEALSERLIGFATQPAPERQMAVFMEELRATAGVHDLNLESLLNNNGYAIRENLSIDAAIRVFELNTKLFPASANAWDSLAEAYAAQGNQEKARALYEKAAELSQRQTSKR